MKAVTGEMTIFRGETACFTAFVTWGTSAVAYASTVVPQEIYFVPNAFSPVPVAFLTTTASNSPEPVATAGGARGFHTLRLSATPVQELSEGGL